MERHVFAQPPQELPDVPVVRGERVTTGSIAANSQATVTLTWSTAFADTNYTVTASVEEAGNDLVLDRIVAITAADVTVRIRNTDALNAATGTIHAIAIAD